ncbi:hypothetical protein EJ05DRAFT_506791 [Pseudovirgaria hyperparasitica]|uniref:Uncharacterized protein n=1 Tax=Pseudovirgaria hyperparasitica TaxID=470096 RepID=A0A6A6WLX9_9PEZI|nr:uncharacterized protein EJ05DRAFT_506791 [Pseudovirgaria hyperparasitica]KAF2763173.1 hypothetical protein EJ05DRAFT_506791 [Pseudovirgaria hyperparasitica]
MSNLFARHFSAQSPTKLHLARANLRCHVHSKLQVSSFATTWCNTLAQANPSSPGQGSTNQPKFSLEDLGATRGTKYFLIAALSVVGTAETYTYARWIHGWWTNRGVVEEGGDDEAEGTPWWESRDALRKD